VVLKNENPANRSIPPMKVLVTGVSGFAGSHLAEYLLSLGHSVEGTIRARPDTKNIRHLNIKTHLMDLNDAHGVAHVIKEVNPDAIFHLAAQSFVGWAWQFPEETLRTNVIGTLNVLEAVRNHCPKAKVHIASSSQVYGKVSPEDMPMGVKTHYSPMNPYDTSKLAQDMLGLQYYNSYGLNIVRTRAFNISGPRRGELFAESSWAKQVAMIERGKLEPVIYHGNLDAERDYIDVRDVVQCYVKACFEGEPGCLYIIGSGKPRKMRAIIELFKYHSLLPIELKEDEKRMRPSDTMTMRADTSDMNWLMGGKDLIPFECTMLDLLNYWRDDV
jgi:GDP-4-dehydro-6-deoxy-D-mannose reductase